MEPKNWFVRMNEEMAHLGGWLQSPLLLVVRLYWGYSFMQTGWGKLHNLARVTDFFTSLGIPLPGVMAHFIAGLEFFGGILLMVGLASRLVALLLAGNMFVAYWTGDHAALVNIFHDPDKFFAADPYLFFAASVLILVFGSGALSVDYLLRHHFHRSGRQAADV